MAKQRDAFIGIDSQGDACIYITYNDDSDDMDTPACYLSENELEQVIVHLNQWLNPRKTYESCPKCGARVARSEAFIDEGWGDEIGRTFYYCSEYCREAH